MSNIQKAQEMLDKGAAIAEVASALELRANTLAKALRAGRLHHLVKKTKQR